MKRKRNRLRTAAVLLAAAVLAGTVNVSGDAAIYPYPEEEVEAYYVVEATDGTDYLYLREGPSMDYSIICNIYNGTVLYIGFKTKDPGGGFYWGRTSYDGRYGWVSMKHVKEYDASSGGESGPAGGTAVSHDVVVQATDGTDYLYLRSGPSMNNRIICNIYNGTQLHITEEVTDAGGGFVWGKTEYNGETGYVSLKHVVSLATWQAAHPTPTATPVPTQQTPTPTPAGYGTPTPTPAAATQTPTPTPRPSSTRRNGQNGQTAQNADQSQQQGAQAGAAEDGGANPVVEALQDLLTP